MVCSISEIIYYLHNKILEEILSIESTKIEHQSDGVLIAQVKLRKTIAEGFQLHIVLFLNISRILFSTRNI